MKPNGHRDDCECGGCVANQRMKDNAKPPGLDQEPRHYYKPIGAAKKLFACRDPEVLLSGAAGTGKSRACMEKLHAMCMKNAGMRGLICRKTASSLTSTALVTFREKVAAEALDSGEVRWYSGSAQVAASYVYGNGSVIVVGGMDKASRIMSSEYDVIYVQEATELTENDWEALTTRLRNGKVTFQQLMADCNPGPPHHWLKRRCDAHRCKMLYSKHEDNPTLWDGRAWTVAGKSYLATLDALSGVRFERLRLGHWAAAEGLVYDTWNPELHLIDPPKTLPAAWPRYWGIDFGYTNPFVAQCWVEDPDGRLILLHEIYMSGELVEDHAKTIKSAFRNARDKPEPMPVAIICDHDAEGRATLERELGVSTVAAHKSVLEGIEAVKSRLNKAGDGKPRLMLARNALYRKDAEMEDQKRPVCTADEVLEYTWAPNSKKEHPLKSNDHGLDAMRYVVAYLDIKGSPRIRSFSW